MKFGTRLQYGLLLGACKVVGWLPDWFLYHCLLDVLYFALYRVARYRVGVVRTNLRNSFPEQTEAGLRKIERGFYRQLAEVFVDTIDMASISRRKLAQRMVFVNAREMEERLHGQSWMAGLAHYGSWEYINGYGLVSDHQVSGIYHPVHNKAFNAYFKYIRSRFGTVPIAMHELLRAVVRNEADPRARRLTLGLIADQIPPFNEIQYWGWFLNQPTAFYTGMEKLALRFGMPVFFMHVRKVRRARYEAWFEEIYDGKEPVGEGVIVDRYVKRLEKMIRERPELWMWSHRRWKHNMPEDAVCH